VWLLQPDPGGDRANVANRPAPQADPAAQNEILQVWQVGPLCGPVRQSPMRLTAVINDPCDMQKCFTAWL